MEGDLDSVFDVGAVRAALEARCAKLESELLQMERIQDKFDSIHNQLCRMSSGVIAATTTGNDSTQLRQREVKGTTVADADRKTAYSRAALKQLSRV